MKLYEHEGKQLLRRMGIATPIGMVADDPQTAVSAGDKIGYPVILKAQVRQGGRGKAGAVVIANDPQAARQISHKLLSLRFGNETVTTLLVENKLDINQEI